MGRLRRRLQAVAFVVGAGLLVVAAGALFVDAEQVAAVAVLAVVALLLGLVAHVHQRASDTLRAVLREQQQAQREKARADRRATEEERRLLRQRERDDSKRARALVDAVASAVERDLQIGQGRLTARLDLLERALLTATDDLQTAATRLQDRGGAMADAVAALEDGHKDQADLVRRLQHETVTEVDAMLQIHRRLPTDGAMPLMWGWALSPRALLQVIDLALDPACSTVVECGSGTSTIYLGRALRDRPDARVVSLEHLPEVADAVRARVREHGLEHVVDVRCTPLVDIEVEGETYRWYDLAGLDDVKDIDLLLVDGPPGSTGPMARLPAFPVLADRLSSRAVIALDDAGRRPERTVLARWREMDDTLEDLWSSTPALAVLRRGSSEGGGSSHQH